MFPLQIIQHSPLTLRLVKAGLNDELDGQGGIQALAENTTMLYYWTNEAKEGSMPFLKNKNLISQNIQCSKFYIK